ncbi:helicase [Streptomyces spiroverticillatus]
MGSGEGVNGAQAGSEVVVKLGVWISNVRKRADKLTDERRAALDALGMEWTAARVGRS